MTKCVETPCCCVYFNMLQSKFGFQIVWSNAVSELRDKTKASCYTYISAKNTRTKGGCYISSTLNS